MFRHRRVESHWPHPGVIRRHTAVPGQPKPRWNKRNPPPRDTPQERAEKDRLIAEFIAKHGIKKLPMVVDDKQHDKPIHGLTDRPLYE